MNIIRGTTPVINCGIPAEIDLSLATEIWFTIKQGGAMIADKTLKNGTVNVDVENNAISVKLTQEETLSMKTYMKGECGIRIYVGSEDIAYASDTIEPIYVLDVVKGGIIGEENDGD